MGDVERLRERPTKPTPERTAPIRSWSGLAQPGSGSAPPSRELPPSEATDEPPAQGAPGAVDMGYRVVEDYLSQGRETAEKLGFGLGGGLAAAGSFQSLTARLFRDGLTWLEHLAKLIANFDAADPRQSANGLGSESPPPNGRTRVRVASRAPAEVDLRLHAGAPSSGLGVQALRSPSPEAPAIDDLRLERSEGDWLLSVYVADGHPAGLYTGVVYDRGDGSIQGTLAVRVG